jgi:hypothetical protein
VEICRIVRRQLVGSGKFGQLFEGVCRLKIDDLYADCLERREKAISLFWRDQALTLVPQDDVYHWAFAKR